MLFCAEGSAAAEARFCDSARCHSLTCDLDVPFLVDEQILRLEVPGEEERHIHNNRIAPSALSSCIVPQCRSVLAGWLVLLFAIAAAVCSDLYTMSEETRERENAGEKSTR